MRPSILVTGATSFLGEACIGYLLKNFPQIDIFATSRCERRAQSCSWWGHVSYQEILSVESANRENIKFIFSPNYVIHTSWGSLDNYQNQNHLNRELEDQKLWIDFLLNEKPPDSLTVLGSCLEYQNLEGELNEEMPRGSKIPYGSAKSKLYDYILERYPKQKLKWIHLYQILAPHKSRANLFSIIDRAIENQESFIEFDQLENHLDFLSLDDVIDQIIKISFQGQISGRVNCCSGKSQRVKDVVLNYIREKGSQIQIRQKESLEKSTLNYWGSVKKMNQAIYAFEQSPL